MGGSAYEDIHLASVEQLRSFWENVVVDRGRDQSVAADEDQRTMHSRGEVCSGDGKRGVHESPMSVSSIALKMHPSDTSAIATTTTTVVTTTTTTIDNNHHNDNK